MCTGLCPCDTKHKDLFKAKLATPFEFTIEPLQSRVFDYDALTPSQKLALGGDKNNAI